MDANSKSATGRFTLALVFLVATGADTTAGQNGNLDFQTLSVSDGLSNYTVTSLLQDRTGFIWVGTQGGLNRFDGYEFVTYADANPDIGAKFINTLYEDRERTLWIGTLGDGLYSYNPRSERFIHYTVASDSMSLSGTDVHDIVEDQSGGIWIATGSGLNRLDRVTGRFEHFRRSTIHGAIGLPSDSVWALEIPSDQSNILWIGTPEGLSALDLSEGEFITPAGAAPHADRIDHAVQVIRADGVGGVWVGTRDNGLYGLDASGRILHHFVHNPEISTSLSSSAVRALQVDGSQLWVGTIDAGLNRLDTSSGQVQRIGHEVGSSTALPHRQINAILVDRTEVLWVGTWAGLSRHNPYRAQFGLITHDPDNQNSLSHPWVSTIDEGQDGMLWIGTLGGGLNSHDRRTGLYRSFTLPFTDVIAVHVDTNGLAWLGTRDNNLYRLEPNSGDLVAYPLDPGEPTVAGDIVVNIRESRFQTGMLWIGTKYRGLRLFDTDSGVVVATYRHDPKDDASISSNYAWPIFEDRRGDVWVGTSGGGLNRLDPTSGTFTRYRNNDTDSTSLSHDHVFSVTGDDSGVLWVGTFGGGLNRLDIATGRFKRYGESDGLAHDQVIAVLLEDAGVPWMSTNSGLSRLDPETHTFSNYNVGDGLQWTSFHAGAALKSRTGELYFGGQYGLNVFHPERFRLNTHPPDVVLTDFRLFNQPVAFDTSITFVRQITLDHDQNFIGFRIAALDFADPGKNQYSYRLDGLIDEWVRQGSRRDVTFTNLDPGRYVLHVRASNSHGVWNTNVPPVKITIRPPWWRTGWAYAAYLSFFIVTLYVIDRMRRTRLEAQTARERAKVAEESDHMKSRFFVNISHEFRTPLTLILGPIEDILGGYYGSLGHGLKKQLVMMRRSGARLLDLINQLLDISKLESGAIHLRASRQDLIPPIKSLVGSFASRAERRGVELLFTSHPEEVFVYFERDKLERTVLNLLSNAFKFTPQHGKVVVKVEVSGSEADGGHANIIVSDTGSGIPDEELANIFDRFHQVDASSTREYEGTGIGLALVKELVTLHGGDVRVESTVGLGSSFTVRLPLGSAHLRAEDIVRPETDPKRLTPDPEFEHDMEVLDEDGQEDLVAAEHGGETVLIVEDNADVREFLVDRLRGRFNVELASDGEQGFEKAREVEPDLVISDIMMPKMDGYELCRKLKEDDRLNHIPVILLTAKAEEDSQIMGLATGADAYIYKPFSAKVLYARIENLIEIRRLLRSRFSKEVSLAATAITVTSEEAEFLDRARNIVEAKLENSNFGVDWLADEIGLSRRQLQRKLREYANLSPAGYIRSMRLERAAQLLEQRAGNVSEVARRVGFTDPDHFSRLFLEVFGVRPSKYPTK